MIAIVTESGKLYARNKDLYDQMSHAFRDGEAKSCYQIKVADNFKVTQVFCLFKNTALWINGEKEDGSGKNTYVVYEPSTEIGFKVDPKKKKQIWPIAWPKKWIKGKEGVQIKRLLANFEHFAAVDSLDNIWVWGEGCPPDNDEGELFAD